MSDLNNIMDDSVYLARDYSSIVKWFSRKLKFLTTDWTDLTISEPDTLCLSLIAYVFDLTNYKIDHKFLETVFGYTKSVEFLSDLYKLSGEEIKDYDSGLIECVVNNKSSDVIIISKYEILRLKDHPKELFTSISDYTIYPNSSEVIKVVRGTPIYSDYSKNIISNGLFELNDDNINRNFINVLVDGNNELSKCEDAIFEETAAFSIIQYKKNRTKIRLSPAAYRSVVNNVVVIYNINDKYPLAENSILVKLGSYENNDYTITSITTNNSNDYTLNQQKFLYYQYLKKIKTLINNNYDTDKFLTGRIDYINYNYKTITNFKSGEVNYSSNKIELDLNDVISSNVKINYIYYNDSERIESSFDTILDNIVNEIDLDIPEGYLLEPMSIYIYIDKDIISDTAGDGKLKLVNSISYIDFNFSTKDNKPISNLIDHGSVNYNNKNIDIVFSYIPSYEMFIEYNYSINGVINSNREYLSVNKIDYNFDCNIPSDSYLIPLSIKIVDGNNIIKDNGEGLLYNYQSEESVLLNNIMNYVTIKRKKSDIILSKLDVKKINVKATVFLYKTNTSTEIILNNIVSSLTEEYKKGSHLPGETIKRLSILLVIENSDPNIKYAKLEIPIFDVALDSNQISDIGDIDISFERSE